MTLTKEKLEQYKARLKDMESKLKGQERKDDSREKIITGSLVKQVFKMNQGGGKSLYEVLAKAPTLTERDARFMASRLPPELSVLFEEAAKRAEAREAKRNTK